jgi:ketosteroid isomerase-like protein
VKYLDLKATMRSGISLAMVLLTLAISAGAQETQPTARELTTLLNQFLDAAGRSDRAVFDRFFADDVIYTRSAGVTVDKAEIMKNIDRREDAGGKNTFSADNVTIHDYGTTAVVNFRLNARTEKDGKSETSYYRNTATFLKRNGQWQAVAWQATRVPEKQ